ncbi:Periplasmic serine protease DegS [Planctomycetales bacterium 10988]|nr:Periplasmic serine protease DegS [Planctomycetales bacterium 10988]
MQSLWISRTGKIQPASFRAVRLVFFLLMLLSCGLWIGSNPLFAQANFYQDVFVQSRNRMVKIYGAGGFQGLEAYQTGCLISGEGHVLTVWSYVLDTNYITVVLDDGRRYEEAELVGADPRREIAILKIKGENFPHFDLSQSAQANVGSRVVAMSNLYGVATGNEPVSVQHGVVAAKAPLNARRGVFETPLQGDVYVLDAMTNNPGAAGGIVLNREGKLLGMLGKELRSTLNNTWLNYAIPFDSDFQETVELIKQGQYVPASIDPEAELPPYPLTLTSLGIELVPDVVQRTPPFIDFVYEGSSAAEAGLEPGDLIIFLDGQLIQSCKILQETIRRIDSTEDVSLTITRGNELLEFELSGSLLNTIGP